MRFLPFIHRPLEKARMFLIRKCFRLPISVEIIYWFWVGAFVILTYFYF